MSLTAEFLLSHYHSHSPPSASLSLSRTHTHTILSYTITRVPHFTELDTLTHAILHDFSNCDRLQRYLPYSSLPTNNLYWNSVQHSNIQQIYWKSKRVNRKASKVEKKIGETVKRTNKTFQPCTPHTLHR